MKNYWSIFAGITRFECWWRLDLPAQQTLTKLNHSCVCLAWCGFNHILAKLHFLESFFHDSVSTERKKTPQSRGEKQVVANIPWSEWDSLSSVRSDLVKNDEMFVCWRRDTVDFNHSTKNVDEFSLWPHCDHEPPSVCLRGPDHSHSFY